jgi:hypothetical protein
MTGLAGSPLCFCLPQLSFKVLALEGLRRHFHGDLGAVLPQGIEVQQGTLEPLCVEDVEGSDKRDSIDNFEVEKPKVSGQVETDPEKEVTEESAKRIDDPGEDEDNRKRKRPRRREKRTRRTRQNWVVTSPATAGMSKVIQSQTKKKKVQMQMSFMPSAVCVPSTSPRQTSRGNNSSTSPSSADRFSASSTAISSNIKSSILRIFEGRGRAVLVLMFDEEKKEAGRRRQTDFGGAVGSVVKRGRTKATNDLDVQILVLILVLLLVCEAERVESESKGSETFFRSLVLMCDGRGKGWESKAQRGLAVQCVIMMFEVGGEGYDSRGREISLFSML